MDKSWRNKDQFHQDESGPTFLRGTEWRDGGARRVGGGSGDDFSGRASEGGFFPRALGHRFPSDFGPLSFALQQPHFEREFSCFGPQFSSSGSFYPTYEQMARH